LNLFAKIAACIDFTMHIDLFGVFSHIAGMAQQSKKPTVRISELKRLCELQCTLDEIAAAFFISVDQLKKLMAKDEAVKQAIEHGQANGKISLRRKQFNLASHSASMAIHLGKQYLGQHDRSQVEVSGPDGGPVATYDYSKLSPDERQELRKTLERAARS
jgi:hypothetical protein